MTEVGKSRIKKEKKARLKVARVGPGDFVETIIAPSLFSLLWMLKNVFLKRFGGFV
jgi:hypothetical protein